MTKKHAEAANERRFEISRSRHEPGAAYTALRELYAAMERHDAQSLVLVRREGEQEQ